MELYKYQGAGNDFLIADNRDCGIELSARQIQALCDRHYGIGADGIMLLEATSGQYGFKMSYYNSDGSGGMMCGNGGRCIVAFARDCGIDNFNFLAADGPHEASIIEQNGNTCIVRLKMKDVGSIERHPDGCFLDTGTRHFVKFTEGLDSLDVFTEGRKIRYRSEFAPIGTNVNFIEPLGDILHVRTYEKGVEDETFACGTGITASAIATWHNLDKSNNIFNMEDGRVKVHIKALRDNLSVDFIPTESGADDVYLTGPATFIAKITIFVNSLYL